MITLTNLAKRAFVRAEKFITAAVVTALIGWISPTYAHRHVRCVSDTLNRISSIERESNEDRRVQNALDLANYFRVNPQCGKLQQLIERIGTLLKDRSDGVRIGAAMALEDIGPRAQSAVPALEEAVRDSDAVIDADTSEYNTVRPTSSSGSAARSALRTITGQLVPDYEEAWKKKSGVH
jgi:hypothetical protein